MKGRLEKEPRDVIPRWRPFDVASRTDGELSNARVIQPQDTIANDAFEYREAVSEFERDPNIWEAGDLLAVAIARRDRAVATRVAAFVAANEDGASETLKRMAADALRGRQEAADFVQTKRQDRIRDLRLRLSRFPLNAVAWSDMALQMTLQGGFEKAERAMSTALHLAPNNRFILRSAARFYVHQDDLERAQSVLSQAAITPSDPWLVAAEIATAHSAGKTSRLIRHAYNLLDNRNFPERHLSELASAVGTAEGDSPTARRLLIRRLISRSLIDPTENSVAQAQWHVTNTGFAVPFEQELESRQLSNGQQFYEAKAWRAYIGGNFKYAQEQALRWLADQPFSSRPAALASQIACLPGMDARIALQVTQQSLTPNPDERILWNNAAYAHAVLGNVEEAKRAINKINLGQLDATQKLIVTATKGAIAFRAGDPTTGRAHYVTALNEFSDAGGKRVDFPLFALAFAHLAYEEAVARTPESFSLLEAARSLGKDIKRADMGVIIAETARVLESGAIPTATNGGGIRIRLARDDSETASIF